MKAEEKKFHLPTRLDRTQICSDDFGGWVMPVQMVLARAFYMLDFSPRLTLQRQWPKYLFLSQYQGSSVDSG